MHESPSPDALPTTWKEIFSVWFAGGVAPEALILAVLVETGAIRRGHFVGASGQHLAEYIDKDVLYSHPAVLSFFAGQIALRLNDHHDLAVVAGPAHGATVLAHYAAASLARMSGQPVRSAFLVRESGVFELREAFRDVVHGQLVLLVEDILTTGKSAQECVHALHEAGGTVAAIAALVARGPILEDDFWNSLSDRFALTTLELSSYEPTACPLCKASQPIAQRPGHGREFLIELYAKDPKLAERLGYQSIPKHLRKPAPTPTV